MQQVVESVTHQALKDEIERTRTESAQQRRVIFDKLDDNATSISALEARLVGFEGAFNGIVRQYERVETNLASTQATMNKIEGFLEGKAVNENKPVSVGVTDNSSLLIKIIAVMALIISSLLGFEVHSFLGI